MIMYVRKRHMMKQTQAKSTWGLRQHLGLMCTLFLILGSYVPSPVNNFPPMLDVNRMPPGSVSRNPIGASIDRVCPDTPSRTIKIRDAHPLIEWQHKAMLELLIKEVQVANTTILLGPNVFLDFSKASDDQLPLVFGPCVTLKSVSGFGIDEAAPNANGVLGIESDLATPSSGILLPDGLATQFMFPTPSPLDGVTVGGNPGSARTSHSLGPLLKFGPHRSDEEKVFLLINCEADTQPSDNVRISGFRLYGPSFDQQSVDDIGILVKRCLNVEISNMEIAGWGGQAIQVVDDPEQGPGQESPNNRPGDRIGRPEQIKIFHNYIHHNQHPSHITSYDCHLWVICVPHWHAAGYGVDVHHGAWAQIYENVFDFNRHAIAAAGDTGGYEAFRNLVLKGGGFHHDPGIHTHQFDVHGSGDNGFGGQAGIQFWYYENSFQYLSGAAIEIRGRPHIGIYIRDNVFAHEGLEDDKGDDAIHVEDRDDLDVIQLGPNNVTEFDPYGRYGVCDFDGDGIDDLFLATGRTWWFSSYGEFPWTYLSARTERLNQVRLGYFDDDLRCDVLTESGTEWVISSAGTGPWTSFAPYSIPLDEVVFGRFDPDSQDSRPGATKRTTHIFWRRQNDGQGEWLVTPLSESDWELAGSSSFPMSDLRFGDFTGDGVTDVLAVENGRWAISESARGRWQRLNPHLSDDVSSLYIADLNNNNIDDLIKLEWQSSGSSTSTLTWFVSDDGRSPWRHLKTYTFLKSPSVFAFAGRFGVAPGGGLLLIDPYRTGHFYSEAEKDRGASPDWASLFPY
jgi:hypothetical protein